jgi:very-short-patch-repair endonuclease
VVNGVLLGFEVDFHWPGRRLVVEVDGYEFHHTRAAFEQDRARDGALHAAGHTVLRLTDRRLEGDADGAMSQVRTLLGAT